MNTTWKKSEAGTRFEAQCSVLSSLFKIHLRSLVFIALFLKNMYQLKSVIMYLL